MPHSIQNNINYTFKMLYVIAIFMIVDGHIGTYDYLTMNGLLKYQNYHIALFCFTSGYFLNLNKTHKEYYTSKLTKLIIPLYWWTLIYAIICHILNNYFNFNIGSTINFYNLICAPLTDGHQFIYNMGSWFLAPLFLLQIISYTILKPFQNTNYKNLSIIFFIFIFIISAITLPHFAEHQGKKDFILLTYRTLYFFPAFSLGFLYRHLLEKHDKLSTPLYLFIILLIHCIIITQYPMYNHTPSWLNDIAVSPFIIYSICFLSIFFWLRIAKVLSPLVKQSKTLTIISNNTFDIMMHHFIGFMFIKALFAQIFNNFDTYLYHNNIWYYHFPYHENISAWIYISITLVIALLIGFTFRQFYGIIRKYYEVLLKK